MKNFLLGMASAVVILPLATAMYFRSGFADVNCDAAPPAWESGLAKLAVRRSVSRQAADLRMPADVDEALLVRGGKRYLEGCAGCHGGLRKAYSPDSASYPRVPQLQHDGTSYTKPEIYWVVKHGVRMTAMSAYGRFYSDEDLWAIAAFVYEMKRLPAGVEGKILAKEEKK